jgi:hypothetical protein
VIEAVARAADDPLLIDPAMLGMLFLGTIKIEADPYTGFANNTTNLRIEANALYHVRQVTGAYRIALT